ncbi:MAG: YfhO family protein, partial [Oscillospiraceae bacterium]|nr:YfhO family protein [Oscillospiraceae bacterium]
RGVDTVGSSGYNSYPTSFAEVEALIDQQDESDLFHRSEITTWYTLNDPALYYYNGVAQFSSMANEDISIFIRKIGLLGAEGSNRYFYCNTSPLANLLLDVRYIIARDGYSADTVSMHEVASTEKCSMYENDYLLGLGFMMPDSMADYELPEQDNPFETQNELFRNITGVNEDLFTQIDITHVGHKGFDVTRKSYGSYHYQLQDDAGDEKFLKYNYTTVQTGMAYAYAKVKNADQLEIRENNGDLIHKYNISRQPYITPVGYFDEGTLVNLKCTMKEEAKSGDVNIYFYQLNEDVLKKGYEAIQNGGLTLTSFADTNLSGTVNASQNGMLYLSIPYEEGWSVWVDGHKSELFPVMGAMSGVKLTSGTHQISLKYSPKGFTSGVFIGVICLGILIYLYWYEKKHPKTEESEESEESPEDTEPTEETEEPETPEPKEEPTNTAGISYIVEDEPELPKTPSGTESERVKEQDREIFDFIDSYFNQKEDSAPENDTQKDEET